MTKTELKKMNKAELTALAKEKKVKGYSSMKKDDLIDAILAAGSGGSSKSNSTQSSKSTSKTSTQKETKPAYELLDSETYQLPESYGETKVVLLVQDPYWMHAYWDLNTKTQKEYKIHEQTLVLRVFRGDTNEFTEVSVNFDAKNWYFNIPAQGITYFADLGVKDSQGKFAPIIRSNFVHVPLPRPSERYNEEWTGDPVQQNNAFRSSGGSVSGEEGPHFPIWGTELHNPSSGGGAGSFGVSSFGVGGSYSVGGGSYSVGGGSYSVGGGSYSVGSGSYSVGGGSYSVGGGSYTVGGGSYSVGGEIGAGSFGVSSFGLGSGSGGVAGKTLEKQKNRSFWALLHTELIVYGATEPDAKCTVGGVPIKLTPEGTFSVRFYLKDGDHDVPFVATSADGVDTISITPYVSKRTVRLEWENEPAKSEWQNKE